MTFDQRFVGLLPISYVLKNLYFSTFFFTCSVFGTISLPLPICPFDTFFPFVKSAQPCFHKSYPQSKTFHNIWAVPISAAFCSNAVLITTPSSSMYFFQFLWFSTKCPFFDLPSLICHQVLLMFHIFFYFSIYFLVSLIFFLLFFINSYVSRYSNINYGPASLILIHYNNIWFSCLDPSVTLDHNIPGLSMNILSAGDKSTVQRDFSQIARVIYCLPRVSGQAV